MPRMATAMETRSSETIPASTCQVRKLWLRFLRRNDHDLLPISFNGVLIAALTVTFADVMGQGKLILAHSAIWWVMVLQHFCRCRAVSSAVVSSGPELGEDEASSVEAPAGVFSALAADQTCFVGACLTLLTFWSAAIFAGDPSDEEKFWWAISSYSMYLVHALLAGDLFICLLRNDLDQRNMGGLKEMIAPLLEAPPFLSLTAECYHTVSKSGSRPGQNATRKVVTHHAKEWVPYSGWCDATEFPQMDGLSSDTPFFCMVRVRVSGGAALKDRQKTFEDCHRQDIRQNYSSALTVARLDSEAQWISLCCDRKGLTARYVLASLCLGAVPWRLRFASQAAYLHLVILKKLVFDHPVPAGFHMAPQMPKPRGEKRTHDQWAFRGRAKSLDDPDATVLPSIYVCDFGIHWLRKRFVALGVVCCVLCCAVSVLSCVSAQSRGSKLAAIISAGLLALLEGPYITSFAHRVLMWSAKSARNLGVAAGTMVAAATIVMVCTSFWISVSWESWQHRGPTCVQELAGASKETAWALYLSDGFVDQTLVKTSHNTCHNKKHHPKSWPCQFIYASPIYHDAAAAADNDSAPLAWAVASGARPNQVLCSERGGICGFAAARIFRPGDLNRFRKLVSEQSDPALVLIGDPEDYMRDQRHVFLSAWVVLMLVFFASLHALYKLNCSTSARETADHHRESEAQLGTSGESLLHLLIDTRLVNEDEEAKHDNGGT
eukprot:TRINITY_DN57839_c0_g1_i1.p1 TRINITY_DN57839_c0_g1~~TRINITY_DN57839_c0_g1_i1.p1  ORF type:complete len:720 (-),score=88.79 TRINITY_DN57839_c0_g1_i1:44-2203(-)